MAANFTINQPAGSGAGVLNQDYRGLRAGVPTLFNSAAYGSYTWALIKRPTGGNPAIGNPNSQEATVTFPALRGRYAMRLQEPAGSRVITLEVTLDADGNPLPGFNWTAPAPGEKASWSPSLLTRGVQRIFEELKDALDVLQEDVDEGGGGVVDAPAAGVFGAEAAGPGDWLSVFAAQGLLGINDIISDVATLTSSLLTEISDREDGDDALDARLDVMENTVASSLWGRLSSGVAGWVSAVATATANTAMVRDANADTAVRRLTVTDQINPTAAFSMDSAESIRVRADNGGSYDCDLWLGGLAGGFGWYGTIQGAWYQSIATSQSWVVTEAISYRSTSSNWEVDASAAVRLYSRSTRRLEKGDSSIDRGYEHWPADTATANATPANGTVLACSARGATIKRTIRARMTGARATWTFLYDAWNNAGASQWTGGDPPIATNYAADAALIDAQCILELSGTGVRPVFTGIAATDIDWSDYSEDVT